MNLQLPGPEVLSEGIWSGTPPPPNALRDQSEFSFGERRTRTASVMGLHVVIHRLHLA